MPFTIFSRGIPFTVFLELICTVPHKSPISRSHILLVVLRLSVLTNWLGPVIAAAKKCCSGGKSLVTGCVI